MLNVEEKHSVVLTENGKVYTFGENADGQNGHSEKSNWIKPVELKVAGDTKVVKIYASSYNSFFKLENGNFYGCGYNRYYQLCLGHNDMFVKYPILLDNLLPLNITDLVTGFGFTFAISADGSGYCWGYNEDGQLGFGNKQHVKFATLVKGFKSESKAKFFTSGFSSFSISEGKLYGWGHNINGKLGLGHIDNVLEPTEITFFQNCRLVHIENGEKFTLFAIKA